MLYGSQRGEDQARTRRRAAPAPAAARARPALPGSLTGPRSGGRGAFLGAPGGPAGVFDDDGVRVQGESLQHGAVARIAGVAERHRHVAEESAPLRALHGAAAEALAERLVVQAGELVEVGSRQPTPRLEGGGTPHP